MNNIKVLVFLAFLFITGCATAPYNQVDLLTFVPGGSTYKHYKRTQYFDVQAQKRQIASTEGVNFVEQDLADRVFRVNSVDGYHTVGIEMLGFFETLGEDGAGKALVADGIKALLYGFGIYKATDSGGSSGGGGGKGASPSTSTQSGGDSTVNNVVAVNSTINIENGKTTPELQTEE